MILIHHYSERIKRKERYLDALFDANGNDYLWHVNHSLSRTRRKFTNIIMSRIMFHEFDFFLYHDNSTYSYVLLSPSIVSYRNDFSSSIMKINPNGQQDE